MTPSVVVFAALFACTGRDPAPRENAEVPSAPERPEPRRDVEDDEPSPAELGPFRRAEDPCAGFDRPGLYQLDTEFDGKTVRSLIFVPSAEGPHDLVVLLHGGSATPQKILTQTRFAEQAERDGLVVVAPLAGEVADHSHHWNSGKFTGDKDPGFQRDDVAFLDALVRAVKPDVCARRVLAAGFSAGGQMAHRWGCEGATVDGVLTAAGVLMIPSSACQTPRAVRGYVGTEDKVFRGPPLEGSDQPSAPETIALWAKINRCNDDPPTETTTADVTCKAWNGCKASTELCVVQGFPHGWPSPWHRARPVKANATADGVVWFRSTAK